MQFSTIILFKVQNNNETKGNETLSKFASSALLTTTQTHTRGKTHFSF